MVQGVWLLFTVAGQTGPAFICRNSHIHTVGVVFHNLEICHTQKKNLSLKLPYASFYTQKILFLYFLSVYYLCIFDTYIHQCTVLCVTVKKNSALFCLPGCLCVVAHRLKHYFRFCCSLQCGDWHSVSVAYRPFVQVSHWAEWQDPWNNSDRPDPHCQRTGLSVS